MPEMPINGNDLPPPENIKTFNKRIFVTAKWLAARFQIPYIKLQRAIVSIGQDAIVYVDGNNWWIGDDAFVEIYQHPEVEAYFDETARMTVLHLLGHFQRGGDACVHLPANGLAPMDCELTVCQCAGEQ